MDGIKNSETCIETCRISIKNCKNIIKHLENHSEQNLHKLLEIHEQMKQTNTPSHSYGQHLGHQQYQQQTNKKRKVLQPSNTNI
jgi:hypothetical protein